MSHERSTLDGLRIDRSTAPEKRQAPTILFALVIILLLGAGAFFWIKGSKTILVKTAVAREATSGGKTTLLNASGYVTARREATVSSKVTGTVIEVLVEEGL
jgi:HlyD family secretion protein